MRPLFVIGTRPEIIKLSPVIREMEARGIDAWSIFTGQHNLAMLACYLEAARGTFAEHVSISPSRQVGRYMAIVEAELERSGCDVVVVQGDTFSALAGAMAAFYAKVPVVHVEAGLRTWNLSEPWPEEYNRRQISLSVELHCCPTNNTMSHVWEDGCIKEGTTIVTGNTSIDSLIWVLENEDDHGDLITTIRNEHGQCDAGLVVITCHRRENIGGGIASVCHAVGKLAEAFPRVGFFWVGHTNPAVVEEVRQNSSWPANVISLPPLNYPAFVRLLKSCTLVLSDSGGVAEECAYLQKPLLILRNTTERSESVDAGCAKCVGTGDAIATESGWLLTDAFAYAAMQGGKDIYGDGHAAPRIVDAMLNRFT